MKICKKILLTIAILLGVFVLVAGFFVGYVLLSYNRIGDKVLTVDSHSSLQEVYTGKSYKAISYNIGFGAYSQDYTFFMDEGYDDNGNKTCGYYSKAKNKNAVEFNTSGAINLVKENEPDFVMFQEVDTKSSRSYKINQDERIQNSFEDYDHIHCVNFHTAYLPYPLYDMHGVVNSGLTTISKYKIHKAERKEYSVASTFSKYFDLDRCFSFSEINVSNGHKLYIVNTHMSAYDEGGVIKAKQVLELNTFLKEKQDSGDYIVVGGDFNHDLLTFNPDFDYSNVSRPFGMTKKKPDWLSYYFTEEGCSPLIDGYKVVASDDYPTCRNNDIEYEPGKTFVCVPDGFIVSDNVKVLTHRNIQSKQGNKGYDGFAYSDHEPVEIEFTLL